LTSFTIWVTRASLNCIALDEVATAMRQVKADATAMNRVLTALANNFFTVVRILVIRNGAGVGSLIVSFGSVKN
jgi:hypothetical protein